MSQPIGSTERPINTALGETAQLSLVPRMTRRALRGISGAGSSISSFAPVERFNNSYVGQFITFLIKAPLKRLQYKIWGPSEYISQPVEVRKRSWFVFWTYTERVDLEDALAHGDITPEQAIADGKCLPGFINALGYQKVTYKYQGLFGEKEHTGRLKTALEKGRLTIDKAIADKFITEEEAIQGGWKEATKK